MAQSSDNIKWLYDKFKAKGYDIGSEEEFSSSLSNQEDRDWYYQKATDMGLDMGDKDEFESVFAPSPKRPAAPAIGQFQLTPEPLALSGVTRDAQQSPAFSTADGSDEAEQQAPEAPIGGIDVTAPLFNHLAAGKEKLQNMIDYGKSGASITGKPMKSGIEFNPTTGKAEQSYITPFGDKTTDVNAAQEASREFRAEQFAVSLPGRIQSTRARIAEIEKQIQQRVDEIASEAGSRDSNRGILSAIAAGMMAGEGAAPDDGGYSDALKTDAKLNTLKLSLRQAEESLQQLDNARDKDSRQKQNRGFWRGLVETIAENPETLINPAGVVAATAAKHFAGDFLHDFKRGTAQAITDTRAWDFGYGDLRDAITMQRLANKAESGRELTEEEREAMIDIATYQSVMSQFGDLGRGYRWGDITGTSLSFMKDFALTGGFSGMPGVLSKGAAKLASKAGVSFASDVAGRVAKRGFLQFAKAEGMAGVGSLLKEQWLPWTLKALGTTADDLLIRAPMMATTVQGMGTASEIIRHKLGEVEYNPETNSFTFEDGGTWSNAIWEAGADKVIENYSEMWGAHLPGLTNVTKAFGARNLTAAILRSTREGAGTVISKTANFLKRTGVNGYFGEVGEEYYGQAWRTALRLESANDENGQNLFKSGQFHGDIWGGMALSIGLTGGGAMVLNSGLKYGGKAVDYYMIRNVVNRSDRRAGTILSEEVWDPMRMIIDTTDNANIGALAEQVWNDQSMTAPQKAAVLDYM